jgi:hypothetical protein
MCLTLVCSSPSIILPYSFTFHVPIFQELSLHILVSSAFTCYIMQFYWWSIILFLLPLSLSSIHLFHCFQSAPHLSEYMIIIVCVHKFLFTVIFSLWDKRWPSMQNRTFIPKKPSSVYYCIDKPEHIPHTYQFLWFYIHMIVVHTGSLAGQHASCLA